MPKQISLEICVPNPAHPACKQCDSPRIEQLKPEEQARLRSLDSMDDELDELLFDEPFSDEPDEDDFEEFTED
jgi:hypothetical protein